MFVVSTVFCSVFYHCSCRAYIVATHYLAAINHLYCSVMTSNLIWPWQRVQQEWSSLYIVTLADLFAFRFCVWLLQKFKRLSPEPASQAYCCSCCTRVRRDLLALNVLAVADSDAERRRGDIRRSLRRSVSSWRHASHVSHAHARRFWWWHWFNVMQKYAGKQLAEWQQIWLNAGHCWSCKMFGDQYAELFSLTFTSS